jgi:hypothetical protein
MKEHRGSSRYLLLLFSGSIVLGGGSSILGLKSEHEQRVPPKSQNKEAPSMQQRMDATARTDDTHHFPFLTQPQASFAKRC